MRVLNQRTWKRLPREAYLMPGADPKALRLQPGTVKNDPGVGRTFKSVFCRKGYDL